MATNAELQQTITEKNATIKKLEGEIATLSLRIQDLESVDIQPGKLSGFIVTTPDKNYSEITAGVKFNRGKGIILDGPAAARKVALLRDDFGYMVVHVNNLQEYGSETDIEVSKNMSEILAN